MKAHLYGWLYVMSPMPSNDKLHKVGRFFFTRLIKDACLHPFIMKISTGIKFGFIYTVI